MQFLSDVYLRCPDCDGRRYRPEVLEVRMVRDGGKGRSIADVLDMTVSEAARYFADAPDVLACLEPLVAVGLDYLRLGQPVPTLSGGEAQRLKLAGHLVEAAQLTAARTRTTAGTLFLFDEPTTGLHFDDVAKLLGSFERLLDGGPFAARDRAQPRRDPRGGLDHRPRPRGRRCRWRSARRPARRMTSSRARVRTPVARSRTTSGSAARSGPALVASWRRSASAATLNGHRSLQQRPGRRRGAQCDRRAPRA